MDRSMLAYERRRAQEIERALHARRQRLAEAARRMAEALAHHHHVDRVIMFGSVARDDVALNSDVDLAVAGLPADAYLDAWLTAERAADGVAFDLVRVENASAALREEIEQGRVLYDRARPARR